MVDSEHRTLHRQKTCCNFGFNLAYFRNKIFIISGIFFFMSRIKFHKCLIHIFGYLISHLGRTPYMRIYIVVHIIRRISMHMSAFQVGYALRIIIYFHVRIILDKFIHPGQLETYIADLKIGNAFS